MATRKIGLINVELARLTWRIQDAMTEYGKNPGDIPADVMQAFRKEYIEATGTRGVWTNFAEFILNYDVPDATVEVVAEPEKCV